MTGVSRPSGTVTFLFTDIEGSTRLWDEHPEVMRVALARHDEILRTVIDAAAIEAQRQLGAEAWPAPVAVDVCAALPTSRGRSHEVDGSPVGPYSARLDDNDHRLAAGGN